jgi:hypothetical protein
LHGAETIAGPTQTLCAEVVANPIDKLTAVLAWVVGYVSGVNNLSKADFLKGKTVKQASRFSSARFATNTPK